MAVIFFLVCSYRLFLIMCSYVCFHLFPSPCVMESGESLHRRCSRLLCSVTVIPHSCASTVVVGSQDEAVFWHFVASEGLYVLLAPLWRLRYFSSSPFLLNSPVSVLIKLSFCDATQICTVNVLHQIPHRKVFLFWFSNKLHENMQHFAE